MKKIITLLLTLALAGSFTACGGNDDKTSADQNSPTVEDNAGADTNDTDNNMNSGDDDRNDDDDKYEIDENIDAVADYLGLKNGTETRYEVIGAKAGKEYNDGKVEIYHFDDDSAAYEKLKKGEGDLKIAAHNDGFVLLLAHEKDRDEKLIKKFEDIDFK